MQLTTTKNNSTSFHPPIRRRRLKHWTAAAAVALVSLPAAYAQPTYFLTELPTPVGYEFSVPYQINDQGFVAGASTRGSEQVATIWKGGVPQVLGKLKDGTYSQANAINSKGVVAGEGDDGDGRPLGWVTSSGKLVNFFSNTEATPTRSRSPRPTTSADTSSKALIHSGAAEFGKSIPKIRGNRP
jgi:uncharacterized membrane protein